MNSSFGMPPYLQLWVFSMDVYVLQVRATEGKKHDHDNGAHAYSKGHLLSQPRKGRQGKQL